MSFFDYFKANANEKSSAQTAKDRLQIIVAHERSQRDAPDYLPKLQQEIIEVIRKYVSVEPEDISWQHDHNEQDLSLLELNIVLQGRK